MALIADVVQWLIGEKGQVALAGAAGGIVRWLTLKSRWTDGLVAIVVGSLSAIYLGPLAEPAIDALLGRVIEDEISRGAFSGFIIGLGGISATGWVIDWWQAKRRDGSSTGGKPTGAKLPRRMRTMATMTTAKKTLTSVGYATERLLAVLASGVVAIAGLLAVLGYGPGLEERMFPVLSNQVVTSVTRAGQVVLFAMTVEKRRDCRLVAGDWTVDDGGHHSPVLVTNAVGRPVSGSVTYPPGTLDIGPFAASLPFPVTADDAYLYAILYYDCHFGWLSRQVLGPVPIPAS